MTFNYVKVSRHTCSLTPTLGRPTQPGLLVELFEVLQKPVTVIDGEVIEKIFLCRKFV
jgi:hypothetical protein